MAATLIGPGGRVEVDNDAGAPLSVAVVGGITFPASVEVANDVGNPIPVAAASLPLPSGAATDAGLVAIVASLASLLTELGQKLEPGQQVALDAGTLAALEQITVLIASGQLVGLDATTLAALENIVVSGTVALDAPTLAALETINAVCSGTVELGAATLAALESITATISGSVAVTGPLTDVQLRAVPVPISGTVTANLGTIDGAATALAQTDGSQKTQLVDAGGQAAEVNTRSDGIVALEVSDDCTSFEAFHQTLAASTDTTITFAQPVRIVRVLNWDTANRVLAKDGAIASDSSSSATRIGFAPTASVPGTRTFPFKTSSIHLRSAGASEVSVEGYW